MATTIQIILDITMNLTCIGNWAADDYDVKQKRIIVFSIKQKGILKRLILKMFLLDLMIIGQCVDLRVSQMYTKCIPVFELSEMPVIQATITVCHG